MINLKGVYEIDFEGTECVCVSVFVHHLITDSGCSMCLLSLSVLRLVRRQKEKVILPHNRLQRTMDSSRGQIGLARLRNKTQMQNNKHGMTDNLNNRPSL